MKTLRIPLRVVFYREEGQWIAHCLEFDLIGSGETREEAIGQLTAATQIQVEESLKHDNPRNLFFPAESQFFQMFAAGKTWGRENSRSSSRRSPHSLSSSNEQRCENTQTMTLSRHRPFDGKTSTYPVPDKQDVLPCYVKGARRKFRLIPEDGVSDDEFFGRG
jgi:predicted RNase H-like HicB family nuclease